MSQRKLTGAMGLAIVIAAARLRVVVAAISLMALVLLPGSAAFGAFTADNWTGGTTDFNNTANWSLGHLPTALGGSGEQGVISGLTSNQPVLTAPTAVNALLFTNGGTLSSNTAADILTLDLSAANGTALTVSTTTNISANLAARASSAGTKVVTVSVTGSNNVLTLSGNLTPNGATWSLGASATDKIVLSGSNTFSGTLLLTSGVIETNSNAALNNWSGSIQLGTNGTPASATLRLNNTFSLTQTNLIITAKSNSTVDEYVEVVGSNSLTVANLNLTQVNVSGVSDVQFHKTGAGTLVLTGNNGTVSKSGSGTSFNPTAGIKVDAGTLLVNNASGSPTAASIGYNVNSNATFGGTGAVTGAVDVKSGGHIAPGASVESLGVGWLHLEAGSYLDVEFIPSANDTINIAALNGLTIDSGALVNLYVEGSTNPWTTAGTYALINYTGTLNGAASNLSVANPQNGLDYEFATDGSTVYVTISSVSVPEPATMGLLLLGGLGLIGGSVRRRLN
ncbi:MAG: hypothetical protein BIFFINMI_01478 [Phycisphaerae bacterium]|nr:hypothetical protein [Phycisphaerae bacterium]